MTVFVRLALTLFLTAASLGPALAAEPQKRTLEECQKTYDACYAECRRKNPEQDLSGDAARTACGSTCASQFMACKAQIELERKARPQLQKMIDQIKRLLDEFMKQIPEPAPEPPQNDSRTKT